MREHNFKDGKRHGIEIFNFDHEYSKLTIWRDDEIISEYTDNKPEGWYLGRFELPMGPGDWQKQIDIVLTRIPKDMRKTSERSSENSRS